MRWWDECIIAALEKIYFKPFDEALQLCVDILEHLVDPLSSHWVYDVWFGPPHNEVHFYTFSEGVCADVSLCEANFWARVLGGLTD